MKRGQDLCYSSESRIYDCPIFKSCNDLRSLLGPDSLAYNTEQVDYYRQTIWRYAMSLRIMCTCNVCVGVLYSSILR